MTKSKAIELWGRIIAYGLAREECGNEGNSGEFHDAKEAERLVRELEIALANLRDSFCKATGWMPVPEYNPKTDVTTWSFEKRET